MSEVGTAAVVEATQEEPKQTATETDAAKSSIPGDGAKPTEADAKQGDDEHRGNSGWQRAKRQKERLERELEETRRQNAALIEALTKGGAAKDSKTTQPVEKAEDDPEPKIEDYEDKPMAEYLKAVRAWDKRQIKKELASEAEASKKKESEKSEQQKAAESWSAKEDAAREELSDYDETVEEGIEAWKANPSQSVPFIAQAVMDSEIGAKLAYHFGKHPEDVERLSKMKPHAALMELGRIEARLAEEKPKAEEKQEEVKAEAPKPAPKPVSKAPKPPEPVSRTSPADSLELRDDLSSAEWRRRFEARLEKSRR